MSVMTFWDDLLCNNKPLLIYINRSLEPVSQSRHSMKVVLDELQIPRGAIFKLCLFRVAPGATIRSFKAGRAGFVAYGSNAGTVVPRSRDGEVGFFIGIDTLLCALLAIDSFV